MDVAVYAGKSAMPLATECSKIHCAAFSSTGVRGWSDNEFLALFSHRSSLLLKAPHGFLLANHIAGEVEIISIAVDPNWQGRGIGHALIEKLVEVSEVHSVEKCFLEVASSNNNARKLYESFNFKTIATRKDYYQQKDKSVSAVVMEKVLHTNRRDI